MKILSQTHSEKVPCLEVLTPLFILIHKRVTGDWTPYMEEIICVSHNKFVEELIDQIGGLEVLTKKLNNLLGEETFETPEDWREFLIDEKILKKLYVNALSDSEFYAIQGFMSRVVENQRFDVPFGVPMKAGWDLYDQDDKWFFLVNKIKISSSLVVAEITKEEIKENQLHLYENKEEFFSQKL